MEPLPSLERARTVRVILLTTKRRGRRCPGSSSDRPFDGRDQGLRHSMLIRFGFEIPVTCAVPVPMLLALSPHLDCQAWFVTSTALHFEPEVTTSSYRDLFDNEITRLVMPAGDTTIWSDVIAAFDELLDVSALGTNQCAVENLPPDQNRARHLSREDQGLPRLRPFDSRPVQDDEHSRTLCQRLDGRYRRATRRAGRFQRLV